MHGSFDFELGFLLRRIASAFEALKVLEINGEHPPGTTFTRRLLFPVPLLG